MPVRDFLQDPDTGGMAVVDGDFALVGGDTDEQNLAAVRQGIGISLRMFRGECFLNETQGVDYANKILVKNADPPTVQAELSANIADVPDVTTVVAAALVGPDADRNASISYEADTPYGTGATSDTVEVTTP